MARLVQKHLIGVTITFSPYGVPVYTFSSFFESSASSPEDLGVGTGDLVAWRVLKIDQQQQISTPAFELAFSNPTIFGTGSLAVPTGGVSPFLQVVSLDGATKYTLTVAGVNPPKDPSIQIDNGGGPFMVEAEVVRVPVNYYQINWDDTAGGAPTWQIVGGVAYPFPMATLHPGDTVNFVAMGTMFTVVFDLNPPWPLFKGEGNFTIPSSPGGSTGPQTVVYFSDQTFGFKFQDVSNNQSLHEPLKVSA